MINQSQIEHLHSSYCTLTGISIPLTMQRIYQWEAWGACGYSEKDLAAVVKLLKEKIRRQRKTISCLRFSCLIGNTEWFGEDLGEVQANNRGPVRCADRESVLKSTGRIEQVKDTVRSAADILAGMKAFEEFRALKEAL